jgi:hypothetical protein
MRLDVVLYTVAVLFFILAFASIVMSDGITRILCIASTVILGTLSFGLGYYQRLKMKNNSNTQKT